jgi:DNA primase
MTFAPALLSPVQKEDLCRQLLIEFGAENIRHNERKAELTHGCMVSGYHQDQRRNPTASLNYEKLTFKCFGCGASGGLLWFISVCRRCSEVEARLWLSKATGSGSEGLPLTTLLRLFDSLYGQRSKPQPMPTYSERTLEPWDFVHPYMTEGAPDLGFEGRGIPVETLNHFRIGWDPEADRIVLPHFWGGKLVGWQTRRIAGDSVKYLSSPDFPREETIFNYHPKRPAPGPYTGDQAGSAIVVVESMMSVLKHHHAIPMEATFGASITERQAVLLRAHEHVILWPDNDEAGWKAMEGNKTTPGVPQRLEAHTRVSIVDSPYAEDAGGLPTELALHLVATAVPHVVWKRPKILLCHRCEKTAHRGECS